MDIARLCATAALFLFLLIPAPSACAMEIPVTHPGEDIRWVTPEKGLDAASLTWTDAGDRFRSIISVTILRFDTEYFDFRLLSSRWDSGKPRPLRHWAREYGLAAAVNACMYLKDNETATGYMRSGDRTNNARLASRYGAFFVSGPRRPGLPRAAVLERSGDWERLLPLYENVVQNFRLMGSGGAQLWPENGRKHAVSAVAEDLNGRILFLHCASPVSVNEFVRAISAHRLNLHSAMYAEGGKEASLLLDSPGGTFLLHGLSAAGSLLSTMGEELELPNVLGAVRTSRP